MIKALTFYKIVYFIFFVLAINGCATNLTIDSQPLQIEVFYVNQKSGEKKSIGVTPIQIPMLEFKSKIGEDLQPGEFYKLKFEKKGFQTEEYHIPVSRFGTLATKLNVTLPEVKESSNQEVEQARTLIDRLFSAQRLAQLKEFERAQIELDKIIADYPKFSRAMTMRAAIYFAQNNISESIKWYEEALKIEPHMEDVIKILAKIKNEKQPNVDRLPANKGGP